MVVHGFAAPVHNNRERRAPRYEQLANVDLPVTGWNIVPIQPVYRRISRPARNTCAFRVMGREAGVRWRNPDAEHRAKRKGKNLSLTGRNGCEKFGGAGRNRTDA